MTVPQDPIPPKDKIDPRHKAGPRDSAGPHDTSWDGHLQETALLRAPRVPPPSAANPPQGPVASVRDGKGIASSKQTGTQTGLTVERMKRPKPDFWPETNQWMLPLKAIRAGGVYVQGTSTFDCLLSPPVPCLCHTHGCRC